MLLLAGGKSGRAEAAHRSVCVQLLVNARVRVGAVWGRKVRVALLRCVLFSHPCWLQTMSCPYLDCNVTYTLKTTAAAASSTERRQSCSFCSSVRNPCQPWQSMPGPELAFGLGLGERERSSNLFAIALKAGNPNLKHFPGHSTLEWRGSVREWLTHPDRSARTRAHTHGDSAGEGRLFQHHCG